MNVGDEHSVSLWMKDGPAIDAPKLTGNEQADVVVIGAGIAGLSTAYELARLGKSVIVIDRGKLGRGMIPACEQDRIAQDKADFDRMLAQLTSREFAEQFFARDPLLGPTIASLAEALDRMHERESGGRRETGGSVPDPG